MHGGQPFREFADRAFPRDQLKKLPAYPETKTPAEARVL